MVLVCVMLVLLWVNARFRNARAVHRLGPGAARPPQPYALGRWRWPALGFCSALVLIALVLPVGVLLYWATKGIYSGSMSTDLALGLAGELADDRRRGGDRRRARRARRGPARRPLPEPGDADDRARRPRRLRAARDHRRAGARLLRAPARCRPLYQTLTLLIFALTVHYLPLAIGPISASLAQVSPRVEEAARGLGRAPLEVFRTITAPLVRGGILAGAALVFLHAIKELPATLILAPIGFRTLATEIWNQTTYGFYEASAIPSLILLAVAAVPLYLLSERGRRRRMSARPRQPPRCACAACASTTARPAPSTGSTSRSRRARSAPCSARRAAARRRRCG